MSNAILDLSPETYHSDPAPAPSFSASIGKVMIDRSPAHAYLEHPRLGGTKDESDATPQMDFGTLAHSLVLGKGRPVEIIYADDWRKKDTQAQRDAAHAAGRLPVLAITHARALKCAGAFLAAIPSFDPEGRWNKAESERAILCEFPNMQAGDAEARAYARGMIDRLHIDREAQTAVYWDVKTTENAAPDVIARQVFSMHYDMQLATYDWLIASAFPELAGRIKGKLVFVETVAPFAVVAVELDGAFRRIGRSKLGRAWDAWQRCTATGIWPAYTDAPVTLTPPSWATTQEMDKGFAQ